MAKRRRYSKKSKKNLRKFTDVTDVEEFLEEKRREERTGGSVAEKADEQLYFIAKETSEGNDEATVAKRRRKLRPLRSEANLQPDTRVQPFLGRKKKIKTLQLRKSEFKDGSTAPLKNTGSADSSSDEEYDRSVTYAQLRQQSERTMAASARKRPKIQPSARDLWADNDATKPTDIPDEHYLMVTRKKPVKVPNTMKLRPSALESVEIPQPGASYNPTFEDHQDLLRTAVDAEEQKLRAVEKLEKKLKLASMTHHQREQVWLEEMTEGLYGRDEEGREEEEEEVGSDVELPQTKRPVRAEDRKSKKQRRRQREMNEEVKRRLTEKNSRIKMEGVYRLRSIKKEIVDKEAAVAEKERRRVETEKQSLYQTKRLGKHIYGAPDFELQLSSEISGSLRCLKPEGSLAVDRFKSLQKRNVIEPREVVRPHRRYKLKEKEKRSARLPEDGPIW